MKILESLPETAQNPRALASMVGNLATIHHNQRKFSEAETFYRPAFKRYNFSYLTSGRDLLRLQVKQPGKQSALIIASPDFGEESNNSNGPDRILRYRPASQSEAAKATTTVLAEAYFPPLPGTADEASALKALIPGSTLLINQEVTEARLKAAGSPELLHVTTHVFFLEDESPLEAEGRLLVAKSAASPGILPVSNPLYRSGRALAGANRPKAAPTMKKTAF